VRKFRVLHQPTSAARSSFRLVEDPSGREVEWANRFLDRECLRRVAELTLRTYANGLLQFLRWCKGAVLDDVESGGASGSQRNVARCRVAGCL